MEAVGRDGVYIIEIDEKLTDNVSNPWRTGKQWGIKKEVIERMLPDDDMRKATLEKQACFVPIGVCDMWELPKK